MPLNRTPPPASSSPKADPSVVTVNRKNSTIKLTPSIDLQHSESVPDLRDLAVNITERKKRKFDENECDFYTVIQEMFDTFSKEQQVRFQDLDNTIKEVNAQNVELRNSVEVMSKKYDEFLIKISNLESEKIEDKNTIKLLEERLETQERKSRGTGIEIRNLPKTYGETKDHLCSDVIKIGQTVGLKIDCSTIRDIYRIPAKDGSNPVIVEFITVLTKDSVLREVKNFNKSKTKGNKLNTTYINSDYPLKPIYISETLTQKTQKLYYQARMFKKSYGYTFCWTSNGIVYLKKNADASQIRITNATDLEKLRVLE